MPSDPSTPTRVAVTGMGIVSPFGSSLDDYWTSLVAPIDAPPAEDIRDFDPRDHLDKAEVRRSDDRIQFALGAAARAIDDANRAGSPLELASVRHGVLIGNAHGAALRIEHETELMHEKGEKTVTPFLAMLAADNAPASTIAQRFGLRGPCQMIGGACASGTYAVGDGLRLIRAGIADLMVVGATAGALPATMHASYQNLRVISKTGFVRPFAVDREGFVYRTGAAVLVLERLDLAEARGAHVYGEVAGYANTNDAFHPIQQSGTGAVECVRLALADARVEPSAIAHVNTHGSATQLNDEVEAQTIHTVFDPNRPSVTSIKRVTGHSLGAAGAFEALSVLLSFEHRELAPAGIDTVLDESLDLDVVLGGPRAWEPGPPVSNSFGLGGQNGSVVFLPPN